MRVLLVEDDIALCQAMHTILRNAGHEIQCVSRVAEAPATIVTLDPEIVILDLCLPDSHGIETLEAMHDLVGPNVPIIIFSADQPVIDKCMRFGCSEFLIKGEFTPMDLPKAIDRAVARHKVVNICDRHEAAARGETTWPGQPVSDPNTSADHLLSLAAELKAVTGG